MKTQLIRLERAKELKDMRIHAGLSQQELASLAGVKQSAVSRIESGSTGWNVDTEILLTSAIEKHVHGKK